MPATAIENAGASPAATGNITSGTASEAMIRAASSAAESTPTAPAPTPAGDTPQTGAPAGTPSTSPATSGQPAAGSPAAPPAAATGDAPENRIIAATRNARAQALTDVGQALGLDHPLSSQDLQDLSLGLQILKELRAD